MRRLRDASADCALEALVDATLEAWNEALLFCARAS